VPKTRPYSDPFSIFPDCIKLFRGTLEREREKSSEVFNLSVIGQEVRLQNIPAINLAALTKCVERFQLDACKTVSLTSGHQMGGVEWRRQKDCRERLIIERRVNLSLLSWDIRMINT